MSKMKLADPHTGLLARGSSTADSCPATPRPVWTRLFVRWLARTVERGGAGGLDWAKTNSQGHTICHKAALKGHKALLEWLRRQTEAGVVPDRAWGQDDGGYTPAQVARLAGHVDLAEWLEETEIGVAKTEQDSGDGLAACLVDPLIRRFTTPGSVCVT